MRISKEKLKEIGRFELADPATLEGIDEWVMWLEAILHGPCHIFLHEGEMVLLEGKQLVGRADGLRFEIYPNEHPPPHFHVRSADVDASFAISDCSLIQGSAPRDALDKIRYWHMKCKLELIAAWNSTRPTDCQVGQYRES